MNTTNAAAHILASLRSYSNPTVAGSFCRIDRVTRGAAFRLLSKLGLIEVDSIGCTGAKIWRPTAKALALRDGEELSAVLK